jgi:hypothetical protein
MDTVVVVVAMLLKFVKTLPGTILIVLWHDIPPSRLEIALPATAKRAPA